MKGTLKCTLSKKNLKEMYEEVTDILCIIIHSPVYSNLELWAVL